MTRPLLSAVFGLASRSAIPTKHAQHLRATTTGQTCDIMGLQMDFYRDLTLTEVGMCVETMTLGALNFPWKRHQLFMLMLRLASSHHEPLLITTYKTVTVNFKASILSLWGRQTGHKLSWRWRRTRGKQLWKFHQSRPHTAAGPVSSRIVEEQRWAEGQTWRAARAVGGLSHPATALCHRKHTHTLAFIVARGRKPQRQSSACPPLLIYLKHALWSRPLLFISFSQCVCVRVCVSEIIGTYFVPYHTSTH